jgi:hypothetical protein
VTLSNAPSGAPTASRPPPIEKLEQLTLGSCVLHRELYADASSRLEWVCDGTSRGSRHESPQLEIVCTRHDFAFVDLLLAHSSFGEGLSVVRFTPDGGVMPMAQAELPERAEPVCEGSIDRFGYRLGKKTHLVRAYDGENLSYVPTE